MEDSFKENIEFAENAVIEMGQYKFSLNSYIYELILRSGIDGVTMNDIYKDLDQYRIRRPLVKYCLLYLLKKGGVEAFHTQKNYFKMRYRIKGKWNKSSS